MQPNWESLSPPNHLQYLFLNCMYPPESRKEVDDEFISLNRDLQRCGENLGKATSDDGWVPWGLVTLGLLSTSSSLPQVLCSSCTLLQGCLAPRPLGFDSYCSSYMGMPFIFLLVWWSLSPSISKPASLWRHWYLPAEFISILGALCSFADEAGTVHFSYQLLFSH